VIANAVLTTAVVVVIFLLIVALVLGVAMERGPTAGDVALAYELAWDRLDLDTIWTLSSNALRDGRKRHEFMSDKRATYEGRPRLRAVVEHVEIEAVAKHDRGAAAVLTRLDLRDEAPVHNELHLERRSGSWSVIRYQLRPETTSPS